MHQFEFKPTEAGLLSFFSSFTLCNATLTYEGKLIIEKPKKLPQTFFIKNTFFVSSKNVRVTGENAFYTLLF